MKWQRSMRRKLGWPTLSGDNSLMPKKVSNRHGKRSKAQLLTWRQITRTSTSQSSKKKIKKLITCIIWLSGCRACSQKVKNLINNQAVLLLLVAVVVPPQVATVGKQLTSQLTSRLWRRTQQSCAGY